MNDMNKEKIIRIKMLPVWVIVLVSFLISFISYSSLVAVYGVFLSVFFAGFVFILGLFYYLFLHPVVAALFSLRKEMVKLISPD